MLVVNFSVKNKFIEYRDVAFDFTKNGIYLLIGKNGTGKTSILEKLVFGENSVSFSADEEAYLYHNERYRLFSYVSQTIEENNQTVWRVLTKDNPEISKDDVEALFSELKISDIPQFEQYEKLSGGEKVKIAIAAAIAKKTRYLFLDEPTNYLDDKSVVSVIALLRRLATNHVIIIASHDKRITELEGTRILCFGDHLEIIEKLESTASSATFLEKKFKSVNFPKIAFLRINKSVNYIYFLFIVIFSCFISYYLHTEYLSNYLNDDVPDGGAILVYSSECIFGEYNQKYCTARNIVIDPKKAYDRFVLDDIPELAKMRGIKDIYISGDYKFFHYYDFVQKVANPSNTEIIQAEYVALPELFQSDPMFLSWMSFYDIQFILSGRLPMDEANEVALSRGILWNCFGLEYDTDDEAIGTDLQIDGEQYKIVGILGADYCVVSYRDAMENCGIYRYSPETFEAFSNQYSSKYVYSLVVTVNPLMESSLLETLIKKYPANNYYSRVWSLYYNDAVNSSFTTSVFWLLIPISLILGFVLLLLQAHQITLNIVQLQSYMRYYLTARIQHHYIVQTICWYIITLLCLLAFNLLYNSFTQMFVFLAPTALLSWGLLAFPSCLFSIVKLRKVSLYSSFKTK